MNEIEGISKNGNRCHEKHAFLISCLKETITQDKYKKM